MVIGAGKGDEKGGIREGKVGLHASFVSDSPGAITAGGRPNKT
jgi:hypothetical protein